MAKLVNLGSLCIDYVYRVPGIANAGQTVASTGRYVFPGGKGLNQSVAAARAGCAVKHIGAVGGDGNMLIETLAGEGVDVNRVETIDAPSGHAVIQVDTAGQNAIVIHGGSNLLLERAQFDQALADTRPGDWLLLQNEINDVDLAINAAGERDVPVALNLAPYDQRAQHYPLEKLQLLIVNEDEAASLAEASDPFEAFGILARRYPRTAIVLTLGSQGLMCREPDTMQTLKMGAFSVEPVDETAAGDAFVGYLMAGLVTGEPLQDVLREASAAGALATTAVGAAPSIPERRRVMALIRQQPLEVARLE